MTEREEKLARYLAASDDERHQLRDLAGVDVAEALNALLRLGSSREAVCVNGRMMLFEERVDVDTYDLHRRAKQLVDALDEFNLVCAAFRKEV